MWRPSSRLGDTLQKRWGGGVSYPQLPQAAAALTHTHTHTLSELWGPALERDASIGGGEGGGSNAVSGKSLGGCSRTSPDIRHGMG